MFRSSRLSWSMIYRIVFSRLAEIKGEAVWGKKYMHSFILTTYINVSNLLMRDLNKKITFLDITSSQIDGMITPYLYSKSIDTHQYLSFKKVAILLAYCNNSILHWVKQICSNTEIFKNKTESTRNNPLEQKGFKQKSVIYPKELSHYDLIIS